MVKVQYIRPNQFAASLNEIEIETIKPSSTLMAFSRVSVKLHRMISDFTEFWSFEKLDSHAHLDDLYENKIFGKSSKLIRVFEYVISDDIRHRAQVHSKR